MANYIYGTEMSREEIEEFLIEIGIGTLSLANEGNAYAIPISFAYDEQFHRCFFDLGFGPDSKKREFIRSTDLGCLSVYEWESPYSWTSVVLTGILRATEEIDRSVEYEFYEQASDIDITVFDIPPSKINQTWYEFDIKSHSGRSSNNGISSYAPEGNDSERGHDSKQQL